MKLLALETVTDACSVALSMNGKMTEYFEIAPRRHTDLLLGMIDQLLTTEGIRLNDVDALALGNGPGSFMGARLAVGVAQGLAFGANLPVIAVSSLHALAQRAYRILGAEHIAVAWDARMGEMYWGIYQAVGDVMIAVQDDRLSPPPMIELPSGTDWTLVGNAWQVYQAELPATLHQDSHFLHPSAAGVAELALHYFSKNQHIPPIALEPKYLRQRVAFKV